MRYTSRRTGGKTGNKKGNKQGGNLRRVAAAGMAAALAVTLLILVTALLIAPALAESGDLASKQAQAASIEAQIASINQNAEQAIEKYNQANDKLGSTRQRISENEKALADATAQLKQAQDRLDMRLSNIYRDGRLSLLDVMLGTGSFNDLITRVDLLGKIGDQDRSDLEAVSKYKTRVQDARTDLDQTRQRQERLLDDVASQKAQIESQLSQRQAVLAGVQGDIAQMVAQQEQQQWQAPAAAAAPDSTPASSQTDPAPPPSPAPVVPAPAPQPGPAPSPGPAPAPLPPPTGGAVAIAEKYLGVPYVWAGADPSGFDCSGLVQYVYAQLGIYLPHSAAAQYYSGTPISASELQPGDLVFFNQPISHVGIYIGGGRMIHAPQPGMVVSITSFGTGGNYAGACRL
ncbi:MAG: C40 family peptidase [Thermoleophilia bacterium]